MNLGEKIKAARLERHMTQKDVVGDYITRNMLSKIENGSATPSVKTLEYLAGALGLPAGYFMNDSNGDELTPGSVASARNHFRDGEYEGCVQVLEGLDMEGGYKDEAMLLLARAKISLSKKAMIDGRYVTANRMLWKKPCWRSMRIALRMKRMPQFSGWSLRMNSGKPAA